MTYQQTIDYIYSKLPMFSRIGTQAIKKGLSNITALCEQLGNPHQNKKFIHIAGTNGKGSVSHMLAAILQTAGYKTGLYTSPHLKDIRERIKINGEMISEAAVIDFIEQQKNVIETIHPSFFEITVAMALQHFDNHDVDIAIIETGLGGRLDSTNIIHPVCSVITNIGFDHMHLLGNTLGEIAKEKAGIIKTQIPVVIGETHDETKDIFIQTAQEKNASVYFADQNWHLLNWNYDRDELVVEIVHQDDVDHKKYRLDLTGAYQCKNILPVLETCKVLQNEGFTITEDSIENGLRHTKKLTGLHGRWEVIHQHPKIILDVAHNESGIQQLVSQLEVTSYHSLHIIIGMVKDKDIDAILSLLPKYATYYFTHAHVPRAMQAEELRNKGALYDLNGRSYENVNIAIETVKAAAHKDDLILVCGSVFLVGEVAET